MAAGATMKCLSMNLSRAPARERSQFAFASAQRARLYAEFRLLGGCVLLVTCHRTELYFTCARERAESCLLELAHAERAAFEYFPAAEEHLFLLAAGLESMLLGEDEILGQIRDAYEEAHAAGVSAGLDEVFQSAVHCGRRVRAETKISAVACSIATLAANEAARFLPGGGNVMVVGGTGKFGASVLKNLAAHAGFTVYAAERTHGVPASVAGDVISFPYAARYALLAQMHVVISTTSSPHTVFEAPRVAEGIRSSQRERLFLDLAMPPDIDGAVGELAGCKLVGIDAFSRQAKENNQKKQQAALAARAVVAECLSELYAAQASRRYLSAFGAPVAGELALLRSRDPQAFVARVNGLIGDKS